MKELQNRTLFFGDNLDILREKIPDETIDLIYLDPPFNSKKPYNLLYKEGLVESPAQVQAFEDTWRWTREAHHTFEELIGVKKSKTKINQDISNLMQALEKIVGKNDVLAYLVMMTIRLIELKRILKPTGSIYLHCDPTASHYLKIVMDVIFDKKNFRNEVIWCYKGREHPLIDIFPKKHDTIFFYSKTNKYKEKFNRLFEAYEEGYIKTYFTKKDKDGRLYQLQPDGKGGRYKQYLDESKGQRIRDWWVIKPLYGIDMMKKKESDERLGYPTQKPETLLEKIIKASSKEGDWILDPFCGCGTTVAVAEKLNRKWIGIDITTLAINVIKKRIGDKFPRLKKKIIIDGVPKDLSGAKTLSQKDPFEFEYWVLGLVNAIPAQNKTQDKMRGADKGIDGIITFYKGFKDNKKQVSKAIVQVKSGHVKRSDIATLKGDIERENADAGIFITLIEPTKSMKQEAIATGDFKSDFSKKEFPKIQILTVQELLDGKMPDLPLGSDFPYHKKAQEEEIDNQDELFGFIRSKPCPQCGQIHEPGETCTE